MQHLFQTSSNIKRRVERQVSMNGGPGSGSKPARCSSQGRTGLLLPPKSAARVEVTSKRNCPPPPPKSENTVLKPARVQGNNLSAALLLQKYSGSPLLGLLECGLGPARMWAWGLLECGPSSSKNTRGPPCGACSSVCSAPPSSSTHIRAVKKKTFGGCAANAFLLLLGMGA